MTYRRAGMTGIAWDGGVRTKKREAVLVVLHLLRREIPTLDGMALGAIRSHLTAMNVGVAIRTILSDVGKDRLDVTLHALHFFVEPAQRISCFVVIKFWNGSDRTPARRCMAIFARYV